MRTKLILATVCILTLPLWFSDSRSGEPAATTPVATIAYAGHTTTGNWCECGTQGCLCDPGEEQIGNGASQWNDQNKKPTEGLSPISTREGFDFGTGVLMLGLVLLVWTRLRI